MPNPTIDSINVNGTTYDIVDTTSGYTSNLGTVTGVAVNNNTIFPDSVGVVDIGIVPTKNVWYGTATTSIDTPTSFVVTTTTGDFVLAEGNIVKVQFSSRPMLMTSALNVDSTGAVSAVIDNRDTSIADMVQAKEVVDFVYTNSKFWLCEAGIASTSYYGVTKLSSSTSSSSNDVAATSKAVKDTYDLANGKQDALTAGTGIDISNGVIANTFAYVAGDTITVSASGSYTLIETGHISASSKTLVFMVHLPKPVVATSVSITKLYVRIRAGSGGYVIQDVDLVATTGYTISSTIVHGIIRVEVAKTTAYEVGGSTITNNSVVGVEMRNGTSFTLS